MGGNSVRFVISLNLAMALLASCSSSSNPELLPQSVNGKPVINLLGDSPLIMDVHTDYIEPGFSADDPEDGNIAVEVAFQSNLNTNIIGEYSIQYSVRDSQGLKGTATRIIHVVDREIPSISLLGANPITVEVGTPFVEPGYEVTDNYDQDLHARVQVRGAINTSVLGETILTYSVSDSSGNTAVEITRTLRVVDGTPPVITLNGANPLIVEAATTFVDPGAQALDNFDGNISNRVAVSGSLNTGVLGETTLTYRVTDASGNEAASVTRVVRVVDTTAPVVYFRGQPYDPRLNLPPLTAQSGTSFASLDFEFRIIDSLEGDITTQMQISNVTIHSSAAIDQSLYAPPLVADLTYAIDYTIEFQVSDSSLNRPIGIIRRRLHVTPIEISNVEEFLQIQTNRSYILTADLDLSAITNFTPLTLFTGILDGNGHTISNLRINGENVGLFNRLESAYILNLHLDNFEITATNAGGALAATTDSSRLTQLWGFRRATYISDSTVSNFRGTLDYRGQYSAPQYDRTGMGSFVGVHRGSIQRSQAEGSIVGYYTGEYRDLRGEQSWGLGGLVGRLRGGIYDSSFSGQIAGDLFSVGGMAGATSHGIRIENSSSSGSLSGLDVGGLVGELLHYSADSSSTTILNSMTTSNLSAYRYVGGLLGTYGRLFSTEPLQIADSQSRATFTSTNPEFTGGIIGGLFSSDTEVLRTPWTARPPALPFGTRSVCQEACYR